MKLAAAIVLFALSATLAEAKRMPPKPVTPIFSAGIEYFSDGDGRDEYVAAKDVKTGKLLWRVHVIHNRIDTRMEEDVQWVFVTDLKLVTDHLEVYDEKARCFQIDLYKHHVTKCASSHFWR